MISIRERNHLINSLNRAIPYAKDGMINVSVEAAKEIIECLNIIRCKECKHAMFRDSVNTSCALHYGITGQDSYCSEGERV